MKIMFGACLHEKCTDSHKTKTRMTSISCGTFHVTQCSKEYIRIFEITGSVQLCRCAASAKRHIGTVLCAVKQSWRAACRVAVIHVTHNHLF